MSIRYIEKTITTNFEQDATAWLATNININGTNMSIMLSGWASSAGITVGKQAIGNEHVQLKDIHLWDLDVTNYIDANNIAQVYEIMFEKILTEVLANPIFANGILKTL